LPALLAAWFVAGAGQGLAAEATKGEKYDTLRREQLHYRGHIADMGRGAFNSAKKRFKDRLPLNGETNLVTAYIHLRIVRLEWDLGRHFERIQRLTNSPALMSQRQAISWLQSEFRSIQRSAEDLQADMDKFVRTITPLPNGPLSNFEKFIKDKEASASKDEQIGILGTMLGGHEAQATAADTTSSGARDEFERAKAAGQVATAVGLALKNPELLPDLERWLQQTNDPLTPDEAKQALDALARGDLRTLLDLLKKHPNNPVLRALISQLLQQGPNGLSASDAERFIDAVLRNDEKTQREIITSNPANPSLRQYGVGSGAGQPGGPTTTTVGGRPVAVYSPGQEPTGGYMGPDGRLITVPADWGDIAWEQDPNDVRKQRKGPRADRSYIGATNTVLVAEQERFLVRTFREPNQPPLLNTETGKRIEWIFKIQPIGELGKKAAYELKNFSNNGEATTVRAWKLVDTSSGKTVQESAGERFEFEFDAPGRYEIKAIGETTRLKSQFEISAPVEYQK
jgi:hypothetical protein